MSPADASDSETSNRYTAAATDPGREGADSCLGSVALVGAGPGAAPYLTLRALQLLHQADVVVYDALADAEVLAVVSEGCERVYVGKRGGEPSTPQPEINRLLVHYAQAGKRVVRLKGGDPFVFGRSLAEIEALGTAGCVCEVVPGVSSALAAPLLAGIPLTDPVLSQEFVVVSGHAPDTLNWSALAQISTLVVLMGTRHLPTIVSQLIDRGRSPQTPIAIIRWASQPQQQVWTGTLESIVQQTARQTLSPAVMVVGEVVGLRPYVMPTMEPLAIASTEDPGVSNYSYLSHFSPSDSLDNGVLDDAVLDEGSLDNTQTRPSDSSGGPETDIPPRRGLPSTAAQLKTSMALPSQDSPLTGKTVLVTRSAGQSSQFSTLLRQTGATLVEMPALEIRPPSSWADLDGAIAQLQTFDWLILTSANGVDYFFDRLVDLAVDLRILASLKIAVVGKKTAASLRQRGVMPDFIPPDYVADSLVEHFPWPDRQGEQPGAGFKMLFPRVESGGRDVLVQALTAQGAEVTEVAAYQSGCPGAIAPDALAALQQRQVDVVTFASSKTVRCFCQLLRQAAQAKVLEETDVLASRFCIASIGPQTSQTCRQLLGRVDVEATEYTLEGLTQALVDWATHEREPNDS